MGEKGLVGNSPGGELASDASASATVTSPAGPGVVSTATDSVLNIAGDAGESLKDKLIGIGVDNTIEEARQRLRAHNPGNEAAWLPDPTGRHVQRYWNGTEWTADVADAAGVAGSDPL